MLVKSINPQITFNCILPKKSKTQASTAATMPKMKETLDKDVFEHRKPNPDEIPDIDLTDPYGKKDSKKVQPKKNDNAEKSNSDEIPDIDFSLYEMEEDDNSILNIYSKK